MKRIINGILVVLGFICVGLGAVGVVLPVFPTVPFLIGAALCFAKGSKRFHTWFSGTKLYKENLGSAVEHRVMTRKKKIRALALMTVMMGIAAILVPRIEVKIMLAVVILFNYWLFAVKIKTISEEEEKKLIKTDQIPKGAGESDGQK